MKKKFFIDIDGCIMPVMFPKLLKEDQTPERAEEIVREVLVKGWKMKLYPEFIKFLFNIVQTGDKVFYVTGRKESHFGALTRYHLGKYLYFTNPISEIIFYPEDGKFLEEWYLTWKIETITSLLKDDCLHYVFDDIPLYFSRIENRTNPYKNYVKCFKMEDNTDWRILNDNWGINK